MMLYPNHDMETSINLARLIALLSPYPLQQPSGNRQIQFPRHARIEDQEKNADVYKHGRSNITQEFQQNKLPAFLHG